MANLLSPHIGLNIAGQTQVYNQCTALNIWLSRKEPADICDFTLQIGLPELGLAKDVPVTVSIGYDDDQSWEIFSGYVVEPKAPRYLCKDSANRLFKTPLKQTLLAVTPQDVIKYGLAQAGITDMELDPTTYIKKPRFIVAGENASDLVRRVNTTWGISNDWYFSGKKFCWLPPKPVPGTVYSYEYGVNIIDLVFSTDREPSGQRSAGGTRNAGKVLTVASPWLRHSTEVEIIWPEVTSTRFWIETVRHFLNLNGALRTEFYFREMP